MTDRSDQLAGKVKEGVGKLTGDDALESQGRREDHAEQTKQNIDEAGDKVAGAVQGVKEKIQGKD
ncbi:MAG: CsbD-like [Actinomycetota bacterium]|jgi:uncharacterized protein YjbJ (UPF0337 family)|nr:CsbD-like [Actinomycetota bacterium]